MLHVELPLHEVHPKPQYTNLEDNIGSTAGKVFKILDIWEQADINTMKRLSNQNDEEVYAALGWLAREDKLTIDNDLKFRLKI